MLLKMYRKEFYLLKQNLFYLLLRMIRICSIYFRATCILVEENRLKYLHGNLKVQCKTPLSSFFRDTQVRQYISRQSGRQGHACR